MQAFLHAQNLARFIDLLELETDAAKRELLHKLLIEEADRFGDLRERLEQAQTLIARTAARVREQEVLAASLRREGRDSAGSELRLANMGQLLLVMERYRRTLAGSIDSQGLGSATTPDPRLDAAQGEV